MKVLVCGSRDWPALDKRRIFARLAELGHGTEVIHGGAPGADSFADFWCRQLGIPVREFKAQWKLFGRKAGPIRNRQMLDEAPDLVIAFQKDSSTGTQDTIDEARRRGIPVEVHTA